MPEITADLIIATPIRGYDVSADFCESLGSTAGECARAGINLSWSKYSPCPFVSWGRDLLTAQFMASGATHLLFIDADIGWEPADVVRLVRADKPIIGGVYRQKREGLVWPVQGIGKADGDCVPVDRLPAGFLCIKREALLHILSKTAPQRYGWAEIPKGLAVDLDKIKPWLVHLWADHVSQTEGMVGEDWAFCDTARACGIQPYALRGCALSHTGEARFVGRWDV